VEAYYNRGLAYLNKGDDDRAIADLDKAVELAPLFFEAYCNRGLAYLNKGDDDRAISDFDKAVELAPKFAQAYFGRGMARSSKGEWETAIEQFAKAVAIDPRHVDAHFYWGVALGQLGRHAAECEKYAKAVEIEPRHAEAYHNWGLALGQLGRHEEACQKSEKATKIEPRLAEAYLGWGLSLSEMGRPAEAREKLAQAVKLKPELARVIPSVPSGPADASGPAKGGTHHGGVPGGPARLTVNRDLVAEVHHLGPATMPPGEGLSADWSPDGRHVAFLKSRVTTVYLAHDGKTASLTGLLLAELWTARTDGWQPRRLTRCEDGQPMDEIAEAASPRWSPDGKKLAYLSGRIGGRVVLLDVATGESTQLDYAAVAMRWAPGGKSLAIAGCEHEAFANPNRRLYVATVGVGARKFRKIAEVRDAEIGDWSPDGTQLLYTTWTSPAGHVQWLRARLDESYRGGSELWIARLGGSAPRRVATHVAGRGMWSADGKSIVYRGDSTKPGVWRMSLATRKRELVVRGGVRFAQWVRAGEHLFYLQEMAGKQADLHLLRTREGRKCRITTSGNTVEALASPDGSHVVVIASDGATKGTRSNTFLLALKGKARP
jgi:tetratricopeptide (TPR) repeat protein